MRPRTCSWCRPLRLLPRGAPLALWVALSALIGCGDDSASPVSPEAEPTTAAATATPIVWTFVSTGGAHSCGLAADQRAYCWGLNDDGQLGDGTLVTRSRPVPVALGLRFMQVSAGEYFTCGLTTDSLVYCWGTNENGQLGIGTRTGQLKPVLVKGGRRYSGVTTGGEYGCAVTTANRAYCWGANYHGQLGDNTTTERLTPVAVRGGSAFDGWYQGPGTPAG